MGLVGRSILSAADLEPDELLAVLKTAQMMKANSHDHSGPLTGKFIGMLFEKPSLRTRVSFEVASARLGARTCYLSPQEVGLGKRESVEDVGKVLTRYVDCIVARTFSHGALEEMARVATVPVINALSDAEHPCQAFADLLTIIERREKLQGLKLAYIGDGNNVAISLCYAGARAGMSVSVASPEGYELPEACLKRSAELAIGGATFTQVRDPAEAVSGADALYTDVWASMGQEEEKDARKKDFEGYRIDAALLAKANDDAIVLHCLPAHYDEEIEHAVAHGPQSAIFDQAENRLHAQQALMRHLMID